MRRAGKSNYRRASEQRERPFIRVPDTAPHLFARIHARLLAGTDYPVCLLMVMTSTCDSIASPDVGLL